jgi:hypothetical protein
VTERIESGDAQQYQIVYDAMNTFFDWRRYLVTRFMIMVAAAIGGYRISIKQASRADFCAR